MTSNVAHWSFFLNCLCRCVWSFYPREWRYGWGSNHLPSLVPLWTTKEVMFSDDLLKRFNSLFPQLIVASRKGQIWTLEYFGKLSDSSATMWLEKNAKKNPEFWNLGKKRSIKKNNNTTLRFVVACSKHGGWKNKSEKSFTKYDGNFCGNKGKSKVIKYIEMFWSSNPGTALPFRKTPITYSTHLRMILIYT